MRRSLAAASIPLLRRSFRRITSASTSSIPETLSGAGDDVESSACKRSVLQRPAVVKKCHVPHDSCRLIGTVSGQVLEAKGSTPDYPKVYTFLDVSSTSTDRRSSFQILLYMKENLARVSLKYLKRGDYICVGGCLGSYKKVAPNGICEYFQKVLVKDLNYVLTNIPEEVSDKHEDLVSKESTPSVSSAFGFDKEHTSDLNDEMIKQ